MNYDCFDFNMLFSCFSGNQTADWQIREAIRLIKLGADVNAVCKLNKTALHKAIKNGHYNMVDFLLKNNADLNSKNKLGETPVYVATKLNQKKCLVLLLKKVAGINEMPRKVYRHNKVVRFYLYQVPSLCLRYLKAF